MRLFANDGFATVRANIPASPSATTNFVTFFSILHLHLARAAGFRSVTWRLPNVHARRKCRLPTESIGCRYRSVGRRKPNGLYLEADPELSEALRCRGNHCQRKIRRVLAQKSCQR